jgi:mannosyltransferase
MTLHMTSQKIKLDMIANSKKKDEGLSWRQQLGRLLPILSAYLALAFYGIGHQSLGEDEFLSVARVASPIPIWKDGHGFLYFALLRLWMQLGTSELMLRSLSALLGAVAVCLTYAISSTLFNRRMTVIGTALFATSPFFIWYSQEVRYITLTVVTTLLSMYAFHRLISRPRLGWWLAYGSITLLAFFSFLSTLLVPAAQGLSLLMSPSHRLLLRKWIVCQMVIFALLACWIVNGTHYWKAFTEAISGGQQTLLHDPKQTIMVDFTPLPPAPIPYTFFALSTGFSLGPSLPELHTARFAALVPYAPMLFLISGLFGGLSLFGLMALRRHRDAGMLLTLWIGVPIIGALGISALTNMIYSVRYVAMVLPAYALILAAGIVSFRQPVVQMTLLAAVLVVHSVALANYYSNPRYAREDTRAAAQFLESMAGPRDAILVVGTVSSLRYYYKGNLPITNPGVLDGDTQPLADRLQELSANRDRLWLIQIRPWQTDRTGKVKATLDDTYDLVEYQHFPGVDVYAYQVPK